MRMVSDMDVNHLLEKKLDRFDCDFALTIVYFGLAFGDLVRRVHILLEFTFEGGLTLVDAAPSLDLLGFLLLVILNQVDGGLTDHNNLFVLHCGGTTGLDYGLDGVLDLGGALVASVVFILKR